MAGKARMISEETIDKAKSLLANLPEKPKAKIGRTTSEAVAEIRAAIKAAQAKGYTLEEIVEQLKNEAGFEAGISTIKSALSSGRKKSTRSQPSQAKISQQSRQQKANNGEADSTENNGINTPAASSSTDTSNQLTAGAQKRGVR